MDFDFQGCSGLTNIVLGNNIMSIGNYAFDSCSSLSSVTIGNNVGIIESYAFQYCYNLASIVIPNSITNIQRFAFNGCTSLTHVMIGSDLIGLGDYEGYGAGGLAFYLCPSLTAISVDLQNPNYSSVDGVLYDKSQTTLIQYPAGKIGNSFTISDSVTNIGVFAFNSCTSLASITTGDGIVNIRSYAFYDSGSVAMVTMRNYIDSIGDYAFSYCANLTGIFFEGGPPNSVGYDGLANNATIYYLPEMTGWGAAFAGRPTKLWVPQMQTIGTNSSMQTNQFGFNINWANGKAVVVEACTNLSNTDWQPVQTNTLADGSAYFSDSQWTNYPNRFYRLRSP